MRRPRREASDPREWFETDERKQLDPNSPNRGLLEDDVHRIFPRIMNSIASAGLPKNGYVVSLLSWLASQQVSVDAINEATLIRTIVEHLLERGRFDAVLRGQFDPEFKEIFLADLGFHLRQMGGRAPYNEVLAFTIDFFTRRNLNFEADRVLRALQNCRILDVSDGYMSFRLPCYQKRTSLHAF